jgi:hypothetical protein
MAWWVAIGAAIGSVVGVAINNIPVCVASGTGIGVALGAAWSQRSRKP